MFAYRDFKFKNIFCCKVAENDMNGAEKTDIKKLTRSLSKVSTASQKSKTRFSDNGDDNPR